MRVSANRGQLESGSKTIPLIVIGSLKSGGSGKTSVTMELARIFSHQGFRVAILAYRLGTGKKGKVKGKVDLIARFKTNASIDLDDVQEVFAEGDWRQSSDEAVMMKRLTPARVFVTRNRAHAIKSLNRDFDLILTDDGFQDLQLVAAKRILLVEPNVRPGLWDLLPSGRYRETWAARKRADLIWEGPLRFGAEWALADNTEKELKAGNFYRKLVFPDGFDFKREWIVLCSLGNNAEFNRDLLAAGVKVVAVIEGRNHHGVNGGEVRAATAQFGKAGILCSEKDAVKLNGEGLGWKGEFWVVGQRILLPPSMITAVEEWVVRGGSKKG